MPSELITSYQYNKHLCRLFSPAILTRRGYQWNPSSREYLIACLGPVHVNTVVEMCRLPLQPCDANL